ncbi:sialidase-3-like isoform X1 [Gambusia affinis]|uniref:sialidase-3-like isoform X1 n=2 Tax=Gambusia affinis TaxID=33528 RepID=UPI001CDC7A8C|nr:sialidase-3-like isoform X1 [Gambusia affinis]
MASMGNIATVFQSGKGEEFRYPALYYNDNEEKLFAFAEKRTTATDATSMLVMRTGIVDTNEATKMKEVKMFEAEEVVGVTKINNSTYRPMNPCVVYEKNTETLFLFFIYVNETEQWQLRHHQNVARLCYITKKINDDKWSEFTDVTNVLPTKGWSTFAVGPGHGIQTEKGRMIVPAYAYKKENNIPHSFYIYSDDNGSTWQYGMMLDKPSGECQMAEVSDGLIYCNARSQGVYRVQAQIDKSGFHSKTSVTPLVETGEGCHGSVVSFPDQFGEPNTKWLLYSHPTNQSERLDLGIYLNNSPQNSDENCSGEWSQPWIINPGPSGYSDLTYIEGGLFACLMERGEKTYTEEIVFQVFSYDDIQKAIKG